MENIIKIQLSNKIEDYTTYDKILAKFYKKLCEEITLLFIINVQVINFLQYNH